MEESRQKAIEMKDELVQDFQKIRDNFSDDFTEKSFDERHTEKIVTQPNGCYKIVRTSTPPPWLSEQQGEEWIQKTDDFLDYLMNDVQGIEIPEEEIFNEVCIILKGISKDGTEVTIDTVTCSKEAFAIHLVRDCTYKGKAQIIFSNRWVEFAKKYTKYVMSV